MHTRTDDLQMLVASGVFQACFGLSGWSGLDWSCQFGVLLVFSCLQLQAGQRSTGRAKAICFHTKALQHRNKQTTCWSRTLVAFTSEVRLVLTMLEAASCQNQWKILVGV